jgi:hypothetical protein
VAPAPTDLELALQAVQLLLEPAGIAARDARECLLLQLDASWSSTPWTGVDDGDGRRGSRSRSRRRACCGTRGRSSRITSTT